MPSYSGSLGSLFLDLGIIFIILLAGILGWRKGLAGSIFSFFRWFICIGLSVYFADDVNQFLIDKTGIDKSISSHISTALSSAMDGSDFFEAMPSMIRGALSSFREDTLTRIAENISETLCIVIAFLLILLITTVVTKLIEIALSRKDKKDPIGFFNGLMGFFFGLVKGLLIVSVIMLLLFPVLSFIDVDTTVPLTEAIRDSYLASVLYDHNPIMLVLRFLF